VDKFKSLRWSMKRRVAPEGIKLWKVIRPNGDAETDVGYQFVLLLEQPKFVDIAVMLVESRSIDANMDIVLDGTTPLIMASQQGHLPVVQALLQAGADVYIATDDGDTPLIGASQDGRLPIVQALLQAGADVDKAANNGATPLSMARGLGHDEIVRALKKHGAKRRAPRSK
jgi:ankyrin repeat protein